MGRKKRTEQNIARLTPEEMLKVPKQECPKGLTTIAMKVDDDIHWYATEIGLLLGQDASAVLSSVAREKLILMYKEAVKERTARILGPDPLPKSKKD